MATVYHNRNLIAALPSAGLVALLVIGGMKEVRTLKPKYDEPVKLEILDIAEVPAPMPPKVQPQEVTPPEPKPKMPEPKPLPVPKLPSPPVKADVSPDPVAPVQQSAPTATPAAPLTPAPTAPTPVKSAEAPSQPAAPRQNAEAEFIARVRTYLNSIKRYPTGREASQSHPEGTVRIWFILRRDGSLVEMGIEESSNSTLLDEAARKSVGRGSFPVFPEQFKPGESQHRFVVDLQFKPASA